MMRTLLVGALLVALGWEIQALEWQQHDSFRRAALQAPKAGKTGFTALAPNTTGIHFTNSLPQERYKTNQILLNGSGIAAGDVDGDGWCDLYFCRLEGDNALYRNLGGWRFQDITREAGVGCPNADASGAAFADLDGDRDLDLVVNTVGNGTHVFFNDGKGRFSKLNPPLNPARGGTSIACGDLDGDGFLDLYLANYRTSALMDMPNTRFQFRREDGRQIVTTVNGRPASDPEFTNRFVLNLRGGIEELGEPDSLYRNLGGTNFIPRSFADGGFLNENGEPLQQPPFAWSLSVAIRDINQDGRPDIYVCNDFDSPEDIWMNQGGGKFRAIERLALRKSSLFSMGIDFADINRDGYDDFLVLDMLALDRINRLTTAGDRNPPAPIIGRFDDRPGYMMNTLFLNRGDGTYAEIAHLSGLAASDWSWAASFLDVDLDGWEDVLISNGHERAGRHMDIIDELGRRRAQRQMSPAEILEQRKLFPRLAIRNIAFRNRRDLTFEQANWGFDYLGVSHGIALADLDNDGDLDVAVNNLNDASNIYRNDCAEPRVAVRLRGNAPNTFGVGARVEVLGGPVAQGQEIMVGGKYLSSDEPSRVFAAGTSTSLAIRVKWPGGKLTTVSNVIPNHIYEISEAKAQTPPAPVASTNAPLFADVSALLAHSHVESAYDDFARQPLLPYKLSQLGPGIAWVDADTNGWEDLVVGTGRGGHTALLLNTGGRAFRASTTSPLNQPADWDQTAMLPWRKSASELVLLAGWSNYESGGTTNCVRAYNLATQRINDNFPALDSATGPLAMADIDSDGDLDLFVGGRAVPGKYSFAPRSLLIRNQAGSFEVDTTNSQNLANVGMVSGAVFSDIDLDNDPDLLLACDWGPVRLFRNESGQFHEATAAVGLDRYTGWWNGIATADFDGDGRQDIVVSNWGRNTQYQRHRTQPLQLLRDDVDSDGTVESIITCFDEKFGQRMPFRGLDYLGKPLPFLRERFATHEALARASIAEMFGAHFNPPLEASWLDTTVFMNRGGRFEAIPLPVEAQMAPAFGVCAADFNGDGFEDIFLAQNFFAVHPETPRLDAGLGLILLGKGGGTFRALSADESGVRIFGEQRGCAVADFDRDGRLDLAVAQNGSATKLLRNTTARRGLLVQINGGPANPSAIGAVVQVGDDQGWGPARELHLGAGYWSSDSTAQVMTFARAATRVRVRLPNGEVRQSSLQPNTETIVLGL